MSTPAIASDSSATAATTTTTTNNMLKCDQEGCSNDATGYYNIGNSYDNHYYCKPCEPKVRAVEDNNSFTYWTGSRDASEREKHVIRCQWTVNCNKPAVDWDYKADPDALRGEEKGRFHCKECYEAKLVDEPLRWTRSGAKKNTIHFSTCKNLAKLQKTSPWEWAQPYETVDELKEAIDEVTVEDYRLCAHCCYPRRPQPKKNRCKWNTNECQNKATCTIAVRDGKPVKVCGSCFNKAQDILTMYR
jgi:hypothetical protein